MPVAADHLVLVTGATGYIGGRLIPRLLEAGVRVRAMGRTRARLAARSWSHRVELVEGDVFRPDTLRQALEGVGTAYYLVHSLASGPDFYERDREAARHFAMAARAAGPIHQPRQPGCAGGSPFVGRTALLGPPVASASGR